MRNEDNMKLLTERRYGILMALISLKTTICSVIRLQAD